MSGSEFDWLRASMAAILGCVGGNKDAVEVLAVCNTPWTSTKLKTDAKTKKFIIEELLKILTDLNELESEYDKYISLHKKSAPSFVAGFTPVGPLCEMASQAKEGYDIEVLRGKKIQVMQRLVTLIKNVNNADIID